MRTKLVAGNWKMNLTVAEASAVVESFVRQVQIRSDVDVVICPPYVAIPKLRELLKNSHIKVGGQDVFWKDEGAYTGKISAPMLYHAGASFCIVGHSEARGRFGKSDLTDEELKCFGDSDHTVNLKLKALLYHSVNPILCVGETAPEREEGRTDQVIREQLDKALKDIDSAELYFFVVAYEPVWAIGTGNVCSPEEAERVCAMIRNHLAETLDPDVADEIRVLYGGSVNSGNSEGLLRQPNIDGALVGGASLDASEFSRIIMNA